MADPAPSSPRPPRHRYHSPLKRGAVSLVLITVVMGVGMAGLHTIESKSWLDAFYLMSMIATGQGPVQVPSTAAGKIFLSLMAFVSAGAVVASLGFLFGPFFGELWKIGHQKFEHEARRPEGKESE